MDVDVRAVRAAAEPVARPTANGRHRRFAPEPDWPGPDDTASWLPQWDGPPPELHPDHPSAPVPRIRVTDAPPYPPGRGYAAGPDRNYSAGHDYLAGDNRVSSARPPGQSGYSGPGYAPGRGHDGGRGESPAPGFQPHPGRPAAAGHGQGQGYPQAAGPQAAGPQAAGPHGSARRLYAVPDSYGGRGDLSRPGEPMAQSGGQVAALAEPSWPGHPLDSGSLALAEQLLTNADAQAATITQDAWSQAAAIRDAAEREAAAIRQQATDIRDAAQQEAAEMRAACLSMSEQLGRLAAYVTENFAVPGGPAGTLRPGATAAALVAAPPVALPPRPTTPVTRPATPVTRPATPVTRPAAPVTKPAGPAARPGKSIAAPATETRGRQARAARKLAALLAVTVVVGLASGATELALHGGKFFIFRANGAGATETGPVENQGPGQPDAPGAQHTSPAPTGKHHAPAQPTK